MILFGKLEVVIDKAVKDKLWHDSLEVLSTIKTEKMMSRTVF
jgi:hypothetical protein